MDPLFLCGDLNVAPEDRDVAHPEAWSDTVLCHPDKRAAPLAKRCKGASIDRDARKGKQPSDHAPVIAVFEA